MSWDNKDDKKRNPWGEPSGGNSGGKRDPWGRPSEDERGAKGPNDGGNAGEGRGPFPPGIDDMMGRFQRNFRGFGGGNGGTSGRGGRNGAPLIALGAGLVVALWLASGFYIVNPGEHAVIQRFGAWNRTVDTEGLKYRLPAPIERMTKFNVNEIRTMTVGFTGAGMTRGQAAPGRGVEGRDVPEESLMLTSDFNIVDLDFAVQWNISSAEDFLFNIEDPENSLRKAAQSAMREIVGQTRMFPIITTERGMVAEEAKQIMQDILDSYHSGINITQVLVNSARVHPDVQSAFQDVQAAKQDAEDVQNRAQAYREDIIPKAKGAATRIIQEAEGYRQSAISRADGDADRFNSVLSAYRNGEDVTKERMYIETMESVLSNAQKIIIDDKGGNGVVPYLPLNSLPKKSEAARDKTSGNAPPSGNARQGQGITVRRETTDSKGAME